MKGLKYYIRSALKEKFAVGAFNFSNMESLKAICEAAEAENSPVIVEVSERALSYMGGEFTSAMFKAARAKYKIPVFLHLDHGKTIEICKKAIKLGFDSVMIDGSSLPLKENIKLTRNVVNFAHKKGVLVEGEIGVLQGVEDEVSSDKSIYTSPNEAKLFAEKTGVDLLAIAIGTSHGAYKFAGTPKLEFKILSEIETLVPNLPLVLHGASSVSQKSIEKLIENGGELKGAAGVPDRLLKKACTLHNICKINSDTDLRLAATAGVREYLEKNKGEIDPQKYLRFGQNEMFEVVKQKIKFVLGSSNKK